MDTTRRIDDNEEGVDVQSHAIVQYMLIKAQVAAFMAASMVCAMAGGRFIFDSLPLAEKTRLVNEGIKALSPETARKGAQLILRRHSCNPEEACRIFESKNPPDRTYDDFLKIIKYLLDNFDLVVSQAKELLNEELTSRQLITSGIVRDNSEPLH